MSRSNPYQNIELQLPEGFRHEIEGFSGASVSVSSPFRRRVDLWFLAMCLAVNRDLDPQEGGSRWGFITGAIFESNQERIAFIELLAISVSGQVEIVREPRRVISIANGLAEAGMPHLVEMLEEGRQKPLFNLIRSLQFLVQDTSEASRD